MLRLRRALGVVVVAAGAAMRSPKWRRSRFGVRALAVIGIASAVVVGAGTAASAKPINSVKELKNSCAQGGGAFATSKDGTLGMCATKTAIILCDDLKKKGKCEAVRESDDDTLVPVNRLPRAGVAVGSPRDYEKRHANRKSVLNSIETKLKRGVPTLELVCPGIRGTFLATADATNGGCVTPTATIACEDTLPSGQRCAGVADTKKHARSLLNRIDVILAESAGEPSPPSTPIPTGASTTTPTTATTSTTTTTAPTTTTTGESPTGTGRTR